MKPSNFVLRHPIVTSLLVSAIVLAVSLGAIRSLARHERAEEYRRWQLLLDGMADAKANALEAWLDGQLSVVEQLAANPSLQLYSQRLQEGAPAAEGELAEATFLRNLILSTAEQHGLIHSRPSAAVQANLATHADNGLALLAPDLRPLTASPGFSYPTTESAAALNATMANGQAAILDLVLVQERPVVGFVAPYRGLQGQTIAQGGGKAIGVIVAYKDFVSAIVPILKSTALSHSEAILVQTQGDAVRYVSPLADGTPAMGRQTSTGSQQAVAYAAAHPGAFMELPDYSGATVLFTSRAIKGTPWVLVQTIGSDEALRESREHLRFLVITLTLVALLAAALLVAAWWYGASVRRQAFADELRQQAELLAAKTSLLDAINANMSDLILLVAPNGECLFANPPLADHVQAAARDLEGKSLTNILGAAPAKLLHDGLAAALAKGSAETAALTLELHGSSHQFHAIFTPIGQWGGDQPAVLITLHDVTTINEAHDRESRLFQQLVRTLMKAIDLHDPYSADHSAKTAALAERMGRAMNLDDTEVATLTIAANLCNLGKLSIPRQILTKQEGLSESELQEVRRETLYAAELLRDLDFPGPLQTTILQKHELLDGSGHPAQLRGEAIIPTARALAVANAFVAMTSPRAYRDKMSREAALSLLMADVDRKYDRKALAALFQVVENESGWGDDLTAG